MKAETSMIQTSGVAVESALPAAKGFNHDHCGHVVQFYSEYARMLDRTSQYIGDALAASEAAAVIATQAYRDGLEQRLNGRGLDTAAHRKQGRYATMDAAQTLSAFMVAGRPDAARFAEIIGGVIERVRANAKGECPRVAVFGEMVALLWAQGNTEAAIQLEKLWNGLTQRQPFSLQCAYPIASFGLEEHTGSFLRICGEHSLVIPAESYTTLATEEERFRNIASLQQKERALEAETASRRTEEQLRLLVEGVQDYAIFLLDSDGFITTWNKGAERIKGYEASEIIGRHFSCFYLEEDIRSRKPWRCLEVVAKEGRLEYEGWRVRKDGSRFWANIIITALRDKTGRLQGFGKVTRDITARMQAEEALRNEIAERKAAERRLHDSEQSLQQLSGNLLRVQDEERRGLARELHDGVSQIATALSLDLSIVSGAAPQLDEKARQALSECLSLADRCLRELRTLTYLMHPPGLDEMGLTSALRWFTKGFAEHTGIAVELDVPPGWERLPRDAETTLFRVVQECLTNVRCHSGSSKATVRIAREQGEIIVKVEDSGRGIPPETLERLRTGKGKLGVGLRGIQERLRQFGGKLEVDSSETSGATITAALPFT